MQLLPFVCFVGILALLFATTLSLNDFLFVFFIDGVWWCVWEQKVMSTQKLRLFTLPDVYLISNNGWEELIMFPRSDRHSQIADCRVNYMNTIFFSTKNRNVRFSHPAINKLEQAMVSAQRNEVLIPMKKRLEKKWISSAGDGKKSRNCIIVATVRHSISFWSSWFILFLFFFLVQLRPEQFLLWMCIRRAG